MIFALKQSKTKKNYPSPSYRGLSSAVPYSIREWRTRAAKKPQKPNKQALCFVPKWKHLPCTVTEQYCFPGCLSDGPRIPKYGLYLIFLIHTPSHITVSTALSQSEGTICTPFPFLWDIRQCCTNSFLCQGWCLGNIFHALLALQGVKPSIKNQAHTLYIRASGIVTNF